MEFFRKLFEKENWRLCITLEHPDGVKQTQNGVGKASGKLFYHLFESMLFNNKWRWQSFSNLTF